MVYALTTLILILSLIIYFRIARQRGLYDVPNERSSHFTPTIIGGGIIFWFAVLLYALAHPTSEQVWTLTGAFSILAIISLWDDIHALPWWSRLSLQTLSIVMIGIATGVFTMLSPWWILPLIVLCLAVVNIYNFMDGINGMHGLYTVVVLGALQVVNLTVTPFVDPDFIWFALIAEGIFLFCNFRRRALCFTGDIGSIVMSVWVITLLLMLYRATGQIRYILFLAVYGVDAVCTIVHRICIHQNIVQAHRLHLYQILANEAGIPQLWVSTIYAVIQAAVCAAVIWLPWTWYELFALTLLPLVALYMIKFPLMRKYGVRADAQTHPVIPFSPPDLTNREIKLVSEAMRSGWITTGPKTKEFEQRIAETCHTDRAVCLNSATAALELSLRLLGIGPGDEVIVPAYTYTASASVILHVGATPVMIDSQPDSLEMDYDRLAAAITSKTKAVIAVDLAGCICDYNSIFRAVEAHKELFSPANDIQRLYGRVIVIADSAHAFGASRDGKMAGEIADFTSFSFHAVKNLTTAEGGAVTWRSREGLDNDSIYQQLQLFSLHGQNKDALAKTKLGAWEYDIVGPWYKCNMTDIMSAIGLGQLERYPALLARRREIIERYNRGLSDLNLRVLPHFVDRHVSSGHLYITHLVGFTREQCNRLIALLAERGIATNVHYKPLPMMTAYRELGFDIKDYPNAYRLFENEVTLPLHTLLSDNDIDYIIQSFHEAYKIIDN